MELEIGTVTSPQTPTHVAVATTSLTSAPAKDSLGTQALHICRKLEAEHLDAVWAIHEDVMSRLQADHHQYFLHRRTRETFQNHINKGEMIGVFNEEGILMGFGCICRANLAKPDEGVEGMELCYNPEKTAVLKGVMVSPQFRGHRLGKTLVAARVDEARRMDCKSVVTVVCVENPESWKNLQNNGFVITQEGIDPEDGSQVYYMKKDL